MTVFTVLPALGSRQTTALAEDTESFLVHNMPPSLLKANIGIWLAMPYCAPCMEHMQTQLQNVWVKKHDGPSPPHPDKCMVED